MVVDSSKAGTISIRHSLQYPRPVEPTGTHQNMLRITRPSLGLKKSYTLKIAHNNEFESR
ncbi:MAG: hypothetical protein GY866_21440 [Proteobacteria bacterium]|nr:hypothetical protein [Pseudomonadota bacterium]